MAVQSIDPSPAFISPLIASIHRSFNAKSARSMIRNHQELGLVWVIAIVSIKYGLKYMFSQEPR